jgi:DNA-binding transcriptional MerR regulator
LLAQPEAASGYRKYEAKDVARLQFIKRAQTIGFTLSEIGELIQLEQDASSRCGDVQERASSKVRVIDEKIADLMRMREELVRLASCCAHDQPLSECRLMSCLSADH